VTSMDEILAAVIEARERLEFAHDALLERGLRAEADELLTMLGDLAVLRRGWEDERDRWRLTDLDREACVLRDLPELPPDDYVGD
jgi:hypothetical protein